MFMGWNARFFLHHLNGEVATTPVSNFRLEEEMFSSVPSVGCWGVGRSIEFKKRS